MAEFTAKDDRSRTSEQISADEADLRAGIDDLAGLVAGSLRLPELLAEVAAFAARAIPGADGAGVTLLQVDREDDTVAAFAASAPFVAAIDEIQYVTLNEGPCVTAVLERRTVRSGSLGGETMWPRFGPCVGRWGVHSALSLPLLLPEHVIGALNVYAYGRDVFDQHAADLGESFAKPAAVAVHNAQILADALALTAQLQSALSTRVVIDQAIGVIRGTTGANGEDAFTELRAMSQAEYGSLAVAAQHVIDEAVRRARGRQDPA